MTEGSNITETLYDGTFIYKKEPSQSYELDYIITEEGRLTPTIDPSVYKIEYYLKDHLGNVRAILTDSETNPGTPELIQESHYYPFGQEFMGMSITQTGDVNNYKYNGKELQTELGLDWYDYGARFYDAQLGRFHTLDPLAENHFDFTPYNYSLNNPLLYIDPLGMDTVNVNNDTPVKKDDVVVFDDGKTITASTDEVVVTGNEGSNTEETNAENTTEDKAEVESEDSQKSAAATFFIGTLTTAGITSQLDTPVPGPADVVAGVILLGGSVIAGSIWLYDQFEEHTSNKRKSNWNKHSKTRPGQAKGKTRNSKRGNKNKKHKKKDNPNKK